MSLWIKEGRDLGLRNVINLVYVCRELSSHRFLLLMLGSLHLSVFRTLLKRLGRLLRQALMRTGEVAMMLSTV